MDKFIDLRKYEKLLQSFLTDSIASFSKKHPRDEMSAVGLSGTGFHGDVAIHFDTADHSAAHVKEWEPKGEDWFGQDEAGRFCDNCQDFAFACFNEFTFPGFPDLYSDPYPLAIIGLDGKEIPLDEDGGDEVLNVAVFPFLKSMPKSLQPYVGLRRARPFRAGVGMNDSLCKAFWLIKS